MFSFERDVSMLSQRWESEGDGLDITPDEDSSKKRDCIADKITVKEWKDGDLIDGFVAYGYDDGIIMKKRGVVSYKEGGKVFKLKDESIDEDDTKGTDRKLMDDSRIGKKFGDDKGEVYDPTM